MSSIVSANPQPILTSISLDGITSTNYQDLSIRAADDSFLHVFQATDQAQGTMAQTKSLKSSDLSAEGAETLFGGVFWASLFATCQDKLAATFTYSAMMLFKM